jgi:uncharacterized protein YkwD
MTVTRYKAKHVTQKKAKISSGKRIKLILGFSLCFIFLLTYIGCSMLYISNNTDYLKTIFVEESHYISDHDFTDSSNVKLLSRNEAISVLSLTEDQILYYIDSNISDSVENAGIEINQQIKKDNIISESDDTSNTGDGSSVTQSPPPAEEPPLPATNSVESRLINMINHIRASRGLQTLIPNPILNSVARSRSQDMVNRGYFSHYTPEGKNVGIILQENGVMYACFAENLGFASPPSSGSPETLFNQWMGSSRHRANLLNPHFGQLGIGVVDGNGRRIVTLVLINR